MVLYGPVPSSRSGLHFLSNIVAIAGITIVCQGKEKHALEQVYKRFRLRGEGITKFLKVLITLFINPVRSYLKEALGL